MSRTPLFRLVRRSLGGYATKAAPSQRTNDLSSSGFTRRHFMAAAGASLATACATTPRIAPASVQSDARVVIVGAGAAGLAAAHVLEGAGVRASIFDAAARVGGRVSSAKGLLAPDLVTELGGEFIDSDHEALLRLCADLDLPLLDVRVPEEESLDDIFFFGGTAYRKDDLARELGGLIPRIEADKKLAGPDVDYAHTTARALDDTTLADYLTAIGATGWVKKLLEVAFVTEFGLEADEQSALNFITLYEGGEMFGSSDERFKVRGGNQRIVDELARRVRPVSLSHRLVSVSRRGSAYRLAFDVGGGTAREVDADVVLLTLPFTTLRQVELRVELPTRKRQCIDELGYGMNAKVMTGTTDRRWREHRRSGDLMSDEAFQLAWDSSRMQIGSEGGITMYSGGDAALAVNDGTAEEQVSRLLPGVVRALGELAPNGRCARSHWPTVPTALGSYACYRPGQWTRIAGLEGEPVERLFFAGEHCSLEHQGYIGGAVETGQEAARAILDVVTGRQTRSSPTGASSVRG